LDGAAGEPEYESAPDVQTDGSVEKASSGRVAESADTKYSSTLDSAYYSVRATLLAPFGLLREYIAPLLAFVLVGLGVLYLLGVLP
jgi:hypothetical protein